MVRGTVRSAAALLLAVALAGGTGTVGAQAVDLAPTGVAARGGHPANPALAARDPATGEWRGPWIDLAGALAQRLGVPVAFVEYANDVAAVVARRRAGAWDVASGPDTPERAALGLAFAVPYLEVDNTLLVGPASAIRSTADADRPGVRIAAMARHRAGAEPDRPPAAGRGRPRGPQPRQPELAALLAAGQVDAVASNRANVLGLAALVPGSRVLADRYAVQEQRINLPPGRSAASLALASAVTRQALASGLIRASLARAGTVGVQPAAARAPGGLPRTGGPPRPPAGVAGAGLVAAAVGLLAAGQRRSRARIVAAAAARSAREAAQGAGHGAGRGLGPAPDATKRRLTPECNRTRRAAARCRRFRQEWSAAAARATHPADRTARVFGYI